MDKLNIKNKTAYISLQEATKYCTHSQEYLSLRARQGKLRSVKIGRNWVTTRQWLDDYVGKAEEYIEAQNDKRLEQKKKEFPGLRVRLAKAEPPKNLPIEKTPTLRLSLGLAFIAVLILAGGVFGKEGIVDFLKAVPAITHEISRDLALKAEDLKDFVKEKTDQILIRSSDSAFLFSADIGSSFKEKTPLLVRNVIDKYLAANDWVEDRIRESIQKVKTVSRQIAGVYIETNDYLEQFIGERTSLARQEIKGLVLGLKSEISEEKVSPVVKQEEAKQELVSETETQEKKAEIQIIQPIKEVIKETIVTMFDSDVSKTLQTLLSRMDKYDQQVSNMESEIARRPSGLISGASMIQPTAQVENNTKMYNTAGPVKLETSGFGNIVLTTTNDVNINATNLIISANMVLSGGTVSFTGDLTLTGDLLPGTTSAYTLGSLDYKWANIYSATGTFDTLGVGTTSPSVPFYLVASSTDGYFGVSKKYGSTSGDLFLIDESGQVGVGTISPSYTLDVGGGAVGYNIRGYDLYSHDGGVNAFSDIRLKDIIKDYQYGLKEIIQLSPIVYQYKEGNELGLASGVQAIGLIAQDLQSIIPDAVEEGQKGYLTVNTNPLLYALINAVKEQQAIIEQLSSRVSSSTDLNISQNQQGKIEGIIIAQGLKDLGIIINEYGLLEADKIKAKVVEAEELRVQPKQAKSGGVTIYDRATSQPYCMYIEYGQMYTIPGECLNSSSTQPAVQPAGDSFEPVQEQPAQTTSSEESAPQPTEEPEASEPATSSEEIITNTTEPAAEPVSATTSEEIIN